MGMYSPDKYFTNLYPDSFRITTIYDIVSYIFLFCLLMSVYYIYLRFYAKRANIIIDNNKQKIGDEIDYRLHGNVLSYKLIIKKVSDTEWVAYKQFRSKRKVSLRKGDLKKIIEYMNRNFGYNDGIIGFDTPIY